MKKLLTIIAYCTFLSTSLYAQKLEIKYQEILNVNKDKLKENMKFESSGSGNLPSDFFDNIIKSMIEPKDFTLSIYDNLSIYKKVEKINNKQGSNFSISFGDADNSIYKDSFTKEYSKNVSLMDKSYLIKDKLTDYKWKLTRETKKIIGFDVKKATSTIDSTTSVVAWYAPNITVKDGPKMYNGLPGLILELEINESENKGIDSSIIRATEVKEVPDMKPIDKPKEKNVITDKEYNELSKKEMERYKEMRTESIDKKD